MILLLKSLQNLDCILSNRGKSKAANALLLTAISLWFCFFKSALRKQIKLLTLNSYHHMSYAALTPEVYIFSF